ncbi:MAG TPA: methyltransferase regulatory domain-containing protein [Pirellulales bacterium]|nr:methyltransferase regulatory domain-containing protein [Pirellulales bacterium]
MANDVSATVTAALKMSIAGRPIEKQLEVPAGPTTPRHLLPILQWFTNEVVEAARGQVAQQGKTISCRAGCGACCRQLVPVSRSEAHHLADLVEGLAEPRRGEIRHRFQAAEERLAAAGLLERLAGAMSAPGDSARSIGMEYFRLGIACPFLEDESCSIHPYRPLACREYLVTSPAENCRQPTAETIDKVPLPALVSNALLALERGDAKGPLSWVPLALAPRWAESHPEAAPGRTGPELMSDLFQQLSGRELPTTEPQPAAAPEDGLPRPSGDTKRDGLGRPSATNAAQTAEAYDEVPYESRAFVFTHPDALATIATLHGMTPPAVERCRVLEIGCAEGGNLIPMALGLPEGRFLGLDLSPRQVSEGARRVEQLALKNIDLRVMDLMDVDRSFGEFDYILCHGVFSWVPRPVQEKILSICSEHLAPQGVAYVSYNVYPGWRTRGMVRDMVLYHIDSAAPAGERVRQARQFLDFLVENCTSPKSVYASVLQEERDHWRKHSDAYLRHDQLGEVNEPFYFHEFAGRLVGHRLQYLSEATLTDSAATPSEEVRRKLGAYRDDAVRFEQYLDFLCERTFRRSLLCHEAVRLNRPPRPESIERLLFAARAAPIPREAGTASASPEQFRTQDGISFSINDPWLRAAFIGLFNSGPRLLSFQEVCREARRELGDSPLAGLDPSADPTLLKQPLLECALKGLVELHVHRWPSIAEVAEKPRASRLARLEAEAGRIVTNRRHGQVELGEVERQVLLRLDGCHTHADLLQTVSKLVESGELALTAADDGVTSAAIALPALIGETLKRFAASGLLDG